MYRVRIDAISGVDVFAGGKRLRCIGNKKFHVGDYAWTDGRCVYGNNYIPQQPIVFPVTAKDDDWGVPILVYEEEKYYENGRYHTKTEYVEYTFKNGELRRVGTFSDGKIDLAIHDYNGNVFVYDDKSGRSLEYISDTTAKARHLLDANINRRGDKFFMILEQDIKGYRIVSEKIIIEKNGIEVRTIDIVDLANETFDRCAEPPVLPYVLGVFFEYDIYDCFIEDENNWRFIIDVFSAKFRDDEYTGPYPEDAQDPDAVGIAPEQFSTETLREMRLITNDNDFFILKEVGHFWIHPDEGGVGSDTFSLNNVKCRLHDGYYYYLIPEIWDVNGDGEITFFYRKNVFAPNGSQIWSDNEKTLLGDLVRVARVNNGHLLFGTWEEPDMQTRHLFFIPDNGSRQKNRLYVLNRSLHLMKNCKGWEKRIQRIKL